MAAPASAERAAGSGDHNVQAGDDDDEAVVEAPRPVGVAGHALQGAVGVVPPQQAVMARRLACEEALFAGTSSGANVSAALKVAMLKSLVVVRR